MKQVSRKKLVLASVLVVLIGLPHVRAGEGATPVKVEAPTVIDSVTVYRGHALVKRVARKDFAPGIYTIVVPNLPVQVADESVRVAGSGTASVRILDTKIESRRVAETVNERVRELEARQRELGGQISAVQDRLDILAREDDLLKYLGGAKAPADSKDAEIHKKDVTQWGQIVTFLDSNLGKITDEIRQRREELRQLREKSAIVEGELSKQQQMRSRETKEIQIDFEVRSAGSLALEASYLVPGATWSPYYDLRFSSTTNDLGLTYQALVSQSTGEDWEDVAMTLSTAKPVVENAVPELAPLIVDSPRAVAVPLGQNRESGTSIIQGAVLDETGGALPGATVQVRRADGFVRGVTTGINGDFGIDNLAAGNYGVEAALSGYGTYVQKQIQLPNGHSATLKITLKPATVAETITVRAEEPLIESRKTGTGQNFTAETVLGGSGSGGSTPAAHDSWVTNSEVGSVLPVRPAQYETAAAVAREVTATFTLRKRETIRSNNTPQKVPIGADTLTCAKEYLAVPALSDSGFLKATATNSTSYPLLTGSGSVFYDENFVSTCSLPRTSVNGKFEVSVGEDSAIQVKRELIDKSTGSAGVFGRRAQSSYRYRIFVENLHMTAQSVTLIDQLPITQNDDIEIKAQEIAPPPDKPADADKQKKDGILRWTLNLGPLEKKEVRLSYSVVHPEQVAVYNLE